MARASLPLALVFILSACGGSATRERAPTRIVQGPGFSFSVPATWTTTRTAARVVARHGDAEVSATLFPLLKRYEPARFDAAAQELDRVARTLAEKSGGTLSESVTTVVDGRKIRAYRYAAHGTHTRIGFLLEGKREYQLVCAAPVQAAVEGACSLLYSSFSAR